MTPCGEGTIPVLVAAAAATDVAGHASVASNQLDFIYNIGPPAVVLTTTFTESPDYPNDTTYAIVVAVAEVRPLTSKKTTPALLEPDTEALALLSPGFFSPPLSPPPSSLERGSGGLTREVQSLQTTPECDQLMPYQFECLTAPMRCSALAGWAG